MKLTKILLARERSPVNYSQSFYLSDDTYPLNQEHANVSKPSKQTVFVPLILMGST